MNFFTQHKSILALCVGLLCCVLAFFIFPKVFRSHYILGIPNKSLASVDTAVKPTPAPVESFTPSYVQTPTQVKGLYITSWTASTPSLRNNLVNLIDTTELNTVVIDVKDYTGKIVFPVSDPVLRAYGSEEVRVKDMRDFVETLHKKGIYVIARIAVFQDAYFVKYRPDLAVKNKAGTAVWKDRKGISWIDPGSQEYWDYIVLLAQQTRNIGFDEINFDYIRFPSDGNMQDISYPYSSTTPKTQVMKSFFSYIHDKLISQRTVSGDGVKISADLFGMVTTVQDDMGIGQLLENALPYFDYIMPMVYPSHYPPTFQGYKNPEAYPYEVVKFAMQSGVNRAKVASTTPLKLRPWLQDFGLKQTYGSAEVRAQIKATYDVGLDSWILWSASNKYTRGALDSQ